MTDTAMEVEDGEWVKKGKLGQGGFGQVYLYCNQTTGQQIAVKKCGMNNELTQRLLEKWIDEVEIMSRINHDNIVKALPTPQQLAPKPGEPVPLVMEYCSGGDLRALLTQAPCGMKESSLRWLVSNISKGVEHLHTMKITHRDLKPENIVISRKGPHERDVTYKIIDLGYAKELYDSSLLYSFVGTMQYLAPELMSKRGYTRTVDFWSFGVVLYECITGLRPFLPSEVPFRWFAEVQKKRPDDICIYYDINGDIKATDKLVFPNHLCRTSRAFFEQFLKLMLRWDPDSRGGRLERGAPGRDKCWTLLDNILNSPLIFVYCVPINKLISYPVEDKHMVQDVLKALERETHIPMDQLELVGNNGGALPHTQRARDFCGIDEQPSIYLFKKYSEETAAEVLPAVPNESEPFPELVQFMIQRDDTTLLNEVGGNDQVKFMAQASFYCEEKAKEFLRIYMASKATWLSLMREMAEYIKNRNISRQDLSHLVTLVDFCDQGFALDLANYETQSQESNGTARFVSVKTIESWNKIREELAQMKRLEDSINQSNEQYMAVQASIEELKAHPFSIGKEYPGTEIHKLFLKSQEIYKDVRKRSRDGTTKPTSKDMLACVSQTKAVSDKQRNELHLFLRKMLSKKRELTALSQELEQIRIKIAQNKEQVKYFQQKKQEDMWRFIRLALSHKPAASRSASVTNGTSPALQTTVMIGRGTMDSLRAINQFEQIKSKTDSLISQSDEGSGPSDSNPDWSFLDQNQS